MRVSRVVPLAPPVDRGRLLKPSEVAEMIGGVTGRWVLRNIQPRVKLGQRTVRYYERDVAAWIAQRRSPGGPV